MRFQPDRLLTEDTPARFDEPAPVDRRENAFFLQDVEGPGLGLSHQAGPSSFEPLIPSFTMYTARRP